ncbi:putative protein kinase RLK-Pelle-CrRLK1L-1 family [Helianthus annuus]|uniref:Protein kinase domain-containing protein n=1 Tax=Helianthus annuus TaxID=4232 RepID=A0A9K3DPG5_HELAN|nr:receptor-like protein kinase HERK 1 [Helianthus annuus]XP_022009550.1 receptor-like protein kinase HERK 1 [Helianthus annuus]KAF5758954.1 putative protein kinase RLK-Pelle-CrRLK1L-1 family [Helianthus annuus]KAJ0437236.1 putative protein kinase RLK-Pelle-CrRLK1L-1 family [Helianthus annuus]KAJ0459541.1 putative protein kinase RLK-Pelle-CrRLK1L-1 family [Helianthus annuus]
MKVVIEELMKASNFQETHKDSLRMSLEDIKFATQNFDDENLIGHGRLGKVYSGEILRPNGPTPIAVKRHDAEFVPGEREFVTELEILFEYKHTNIIGLVGYCNQNEERISVYEYAINGTLDRHLIKPSLTWMERLKIGIDVAMGLDFLYGSGTTQAFVIHGDIKSSNILLNDASLAVCAYNVYMCGPSGGKSESALILTLFY